jgi:hypothetical protein
VFKFASLKSSSAGIGGLEDLCENYVTCTIVYFSSDEVRAFTDVMRLSVSLAQTHWGGILVGLVFPSQN